ncbi:MAG: hypothetical protein OQK79_05775 [Rhodanobacter sp.]|jgi:hypothetical protein|nr:hypothetical protein [Rhodanobacter sp.]
MASRDNQKLLHPACVLGLADLAILVAVDMDEVAGRWRTGLRLFFADRLADGGQYFKSRCRSMRRAGAGTL